LPPNPEAESRVYEGAHWCFDDLHMQARPRAGVPTGMGQHTATDFEAIG